MRTSHVPTSGGVTDLQGSTAGESAYPGINGKKTFEEVRTSQNESETIATQGISPREKALSLGFNRLDSEVLVASDNRRAPDNRRFHKSQRMHASAANKFPTYYEDNIDSETEVFIDPQFESKLVGKASQVVQKGRSSTLFGEESFNSDHASQPRISRKERKPAGIDPDDHFAQIDAVIKSNYDDRTKQQLIADIQERFRQSKVAENNGPRTQYKPRTQKKFKDAEESFDQGMPDRGMKPRRQRTNDPEAQGMDFRHGQNFENKGTRTAKAKTKKRAHQSKDPNAIHQQYLMPEMNELIGAEEIGKRNYLTQDEMAHDSKLMGPSNNKRRRQRRARHDSADEQTPQANEKNFTPGRIRASRMGHPANTLLDYNGRKDNFVHDDDERFQKEIKKQQRSRKPNTRVEQLDETDSIIDSADEINYNQHLPAVKVRKQRKKRSPSDNSHHNNSIGRGQNSVSRVSVNHSKDPKLRDTLDQSLHFVPASIKVPVKQTHFYDDKHGASITQQQLQTWKIKNGNVVLDEFHSGKKKIPVNRHRIPNVGDESVLKVGSGAPGAKKPRGGVSSENYVWSLDGRRTKKPKKDPQRVITSNVSLHKIGLPNIIRQPKDILSPQGKSHPSNIGRVPPPQQQSFGGKQYPNDKFLDPSDPRTKQLNTQSDYLVDIAIGNQKPPAQNIHEPPFDGGDIAEKSKSPPKQKSDINLGVPVPDGLDTEPYKNMLEQNKKKIGGKVVVEDDYIKEGQFRDPGNRKKQSPEKKLTSSKSGSQERLNRSPTGSPPKSNTGNIYGNCPECLRPMENNKSTGSRNTRPDGRSKQSSDGRQSGQLSGPRCPSCQRPLPPRSKEPSQENKRIVSDGPGTNEYGPMGPGDKDPSLANGPNGTPIGSNKIPRSPISQQVSRSPNSRGGILKSGSNDKKWPSKQSPRNASQDGVPRSGQPEDPYASIPNSQLRPELHDTLSNQIRSEDQIPDLHKDGRLYLASRERNPKTEIDRDNNSIDRTSIPLINNDVDGRTNGEPRTPERDNSRPVSDNDLKHGKSSQGFANSQVRFAYNNEFQTRERVHAQMSSQVISTKYEKNEYTHQYQKESYSHYQQNEYHEQSRAQGMRNHQSMETNIKHMNAEDKRLDLVRQETNPTEGTRLDKKNPLKILKKDSEQDTTYEFPIRKTTTQVSKRNKSSSGITSNAKIMRKSTVVREARGSSIGSTGSKSNIFIPRNRNTRSNNSQSPEAKRVMQTLTHHRVKIDSKTKVLINGSEVLTHSGIKGNINKVGVGFGTGRHTSGRRLDLLKEVPKPKPRRSESQEGAVIVRDESMSPVKADTISPRARSPPFRQPPELADAETQMKAEVQSEGNDPMLVSMISQQVSAHVTHHEQNLSARSMTQLPEKESVGVSAKPISEASVREQGDQITEGRFEPVMVDTQVNTDRKFLDDYLKKPMKEVNIGTDPIIIGTPKPEMATSMVQTDPMIREIDAVDDEPAPLTFSTEPQRKVPRKRHEKGAESGDESSEGSLQDAPAEEEVYELVLPPPQEPETEEEEWITDDWAYSSLYQYVYQSHYDKLVAKKLVNYSVLEQQFAMSTNSKVLQSMQLGADSVHLKADLLAASFVSKNSTKVVQASHSSMNWQRPQTPQSQRDMTLQQKNDFNLNPDNLQILSQIECEYGQEVLRHKSAHYCTQEILQDFYTRSKTTIKVLVANMVRPDICNHILFAHYQDVTKKNVIKLLLRVKRLYDARNESINILKLVMETEAALRPKSDLWKIMQDNSRSRIAKPYKELVIKTLRMVSNCLTRITVFQQEHRLFKEEFKFNKKEYREYLRDIGLIIGGYLQLKREQNPALQECGLLQDDHQEHQAQSKRYDEWVDASIQEFGRMDVPTEAEVADLLEAEKPKKKEKGSRIDKAVNQMREAQREKSEKDRADVEMALTSKSRILKQMQQKVEKLEVAHQQSTADQMQKTAISDQLLERMQESADKRQRMAEKAERKRQGLEESSQNTDENFNLKPMPNVTLLQQQLQYDNDMESLATVQNRNQLASNALLEKPNTQLRLSSQLSSATKIYGQQSVAAAQDAEFQQINIGRYDFNTTDRSQANDASDRKFDDPALQLPALNLANADHSRSHTGLNTSDRHAQKSTFRREPLIPVQDQQQQCVDDYVIDQPETRSYLGQQELQSYATPSEITVQQHGQILKNLKKTNEAECSQLSQIDDATEFTEQQDNESQRIGLEMNPSAANINVSQISEQLDQTIVDMNEDDYGNSSKLNILTQGQIKIKYSQPSPASALIHQSQQVSTTNSMRGGHQINDAASAKSLSKHDSLNDRQ